MNIPLWKKFKRLFKRRRKTGDIAPDEIFIDASNLPDFDRSQFEGRLEKPISRRTIAIVAAFFIIVAIIFSVRLWNLQIKQGAMFAERSKNNSLRRTLVFADRGVIFDRNGTLIAWNEENPNDSDFSLRQYATTTGLSNLIGYTKYPSKDSAGFYYREDYLGVDGIEKYFNGELTGSNGTKLTETDVKGNVESQSILNPPENGTNLTLSIDSRVQSRLYDVIASVATEHGFTGGAGAIMDVKTGELLAITTYPEYSSQIMSDGADKDKVAYYLTSISKPLLDRATDGLYTPGSIIKPFVALGALNEGVISPTTVIHTTGSITIQNPYNPDIKYIYRDWKDQGSINMYQAIEQSSDVYFYEVGGGFKDQRGIGIANIEKYMRMFGFGDKVGSELFGDKKGVIPTPEWKKQVFDGEEWTVGNTYHSAIGQYGFQVTPLQAAKAYAAIANYGTLVEPTILKGDTSGLSTAKKIDLPKSYFDVVHDGMRRSAMQGTASALNIPDVKIAAKSGTAELGISKDFVNSWITGFFPYENPRYSFAIIMEHGSRHNLVGAAYVGRQLFDWMAANTPEYLK